MVIRENRKQYRQEMAWTLNFNVECTWMKANHRLTNKNSWAVLAKLMLKKEAIRLQKPMLHFIDQILSGIFYTDIVFLCCTLCSFTSNVLQLNIQFRQRAINGLCHRGFRPFNVSLVISDSQRANITSFPCPWNYTQFSSICEAGWKWATRSHFV